MWRFEWKERSTGEFEMVIYHDCTPNVTGLIHSNKSECPWCGAEVPGEFEAHRKISNLTGDERCAVCDSLR
jgi:hypothetical protein